MTSFLIVVLLVAAIAGLSTVLVLSQRQFDGGGAELPYHAGGGLSPDRAPLGALPRRGAPPLPPVEYAAAASPLAVLVAQTIAAATRRPPRNSAEQATIGMLREALTRAVQGEFAADLRARIEAIGGIDSLHDVRPISPGAPPDPDSDPIDALLPAPEIGHLVVGPAGVYVIDAKMSGGKVSYDDDSVYIGEGDERGRDAMVDDVLRGVAAVTAVIEPVAVHGVIVLADAVTLPEEIRRDVVSVRGVRLATPDQLAEIVTAPGPVRDRSVVAARLRNAFDAAVPPAPGDLRFVGPPPRAALERSAAEGTARPESVV